MPKSFADFVSLPSHARLPFQPFDDEKDVRIYKRGFLPHWRQDGCTYFVTFRTADSVPDGVYRQWKCERSNWLFARGIDVHATGWREKVLELPRAEQVRFERFFAAKLFTELDKCQGECVLQDPKLASIVADAMVFFHEERVVTGDFVVMPNHVHALVTPLAGFQLEDVLHSIKSFTANRINKSLGRKGEFWMSESHDHIVRDGEELLRIQGYIRGNPEKAGLDTAGLILCQAEYELVV